MVSYLIGWTQYCTEPSLGKQFRRLDPTPNILQETLKHETILAFPYLSSPHHLRRIWGCGCYCGGNPLSLHFHPGPRQSWSSFRICVGPTQDPNEACSSPGPEMLARSTWMLATPSTAVVSWQTSLGFELHRIALKQPHYLYLMQIVDCSHHNIHWV